MKPPFRHLSHSHQVMFVVRPKAFQREGPGGLNLRVDSDKPPFRGILCGCDAIFHLVVNIYIYIYLNLFSPVGFKGNLPLEICCFHFFQGAVKQMEVIELSNAPLGANRHRVGRVFPSSGAGSSLKASGRARRDSDATNPHQPALPRTVTSLFLACFLEI